MYGCERLVGTFEVAVRVHMQVLTHDQRQSHELGCEPKCKVFLHTFRSVKNWRFTKNTGPKFDLKYTERNKNVIELPEILIKKIFIYRN